MLKRTLVASSLAAAITASPALAAEPAEHTFTGNVGLYSQYIFRGLRQTDKDPATAGWLSWALARMARDAR